MNMMRPHTPPKCNRNSSPINANDMAKNIIALIDLDDQMHYFTEESLLEQLAGADLPGTAPIKAAFRNLANKVAEIRKFQTQYFAATYGSSEKARLLAKSKELEKQVGTIVKSFNQALERL